MILTGSQYQRSKRQNLHFWVHLQNQAIHFLTKIFSPYSMLPLPEVFTFCPTYFDLSVVKIAVFPVNESDSSLAQSVIDNLNLASQAPIPLSPSEDTEQCLSLRLHFIPTLRTASPSWCSLFPGFKPLLLLGVTSNSNKPPSSSLITTSISKANTYSTDAPFLLLIPSTPTYTSSSEVFVYDNLPSICSKSSNSITQSNLIGVISSLIFKHLNSLSDPNRPLTPFPTDLHGFSSKRVSLRHLIQLASTGLLTGNYKTAKSLFSSAIDTARALNDSLATAISYEGLVTSLLYISFDTGEGLFYSILEPYLTAALSEYSRSEAHVPFLSCCLRVMTFLLTLPPGCFSNNPNNVQTFSITGLSLSSKYLSKCLTVIDLLSDYDRVCIFLTLSSIYGLVSFPPINMTWVVSKYPSSPLVQAPCKRKCSLFLEKAANVLILMQNFEACELAFVLLRSCFEYYGLCRNIYQNIWFTVDSLLTASTSIDCNCRLVTSAKWPLITTQVLADLLNCAKIFAKNSENPTLLLTVLLAQLFQYKPEEALKQNFYMTLLEDVVTLSCNISRQIFIGFSIPLVQSIVISPMQIFEIPKISSQNSQETSPFLVVSKSMANFKKVVKNFVCWSCFEAGIITLNLSNPYNFPLKISKVSLYMKHTSFENADQFFTTDANISEQILDSKPLNFEFSLHGQSPGQLEILALIIQINNLNMVYKITSLVPKSEKFEEKFQESCRILSVFETLNRIKVLEMPTFLMDYVESRGFLTVTNQSENLSVDMSSFDLDFELIPDNFDNQSSILTTHRQFLITEFSKILPIPPKESRKFFLPDVPFSYDLTVKLLSKPVTNRPHSTVSWSSISIPARSTVEVVEILETKFLGSEVFSATLSIRGSSVHVIDVWSTVDAAKISPQNSCPMCTLLVSTSFPYIQYKNFAGKISELKVTPPNPPALPPLTPSSDHFFIQLGTLSYVSIILRRTAVLSLAVEKGQEGLVFVEGMTVRRVEVGEEQVVVKFGLVLLFNSQVRLNFSAKFLDGSCSSCSLLVCPRD
ncbi:hypothetical protein RCL1_000793 [Eukaryota sp. TZLM3-RCL]